MQVSTPIPAGIQPGRTRQIGLIVAVATVIAVGAWALASYVFDAGQPVQQSAAARASVSASPTPIARRYIEAIGGMTAAQIAAAFGGQSQTDASLLASLTPRDRRYVEGIAALSPAEIAAAFGGQSQTDASVLASLTPSARRYVEAIGALSPAQIAAAFGTGR